MNATLLRIVVVFYYYYPILFTVVNEFIGLKASSACISAVGIAIKFFRSFPEFVSFMLHYEFKTIGRFFVMFFFHGTSFLPPIVDFPTEYARAAIFVARVK